MGLVADGTCGIWIARRIPMTALPQLVAGFHSLVGLAAACVAAAVFDSPQSFGHGEGLSFSAGRLLKMGLGVSMTFTGSIVGFLKLQGFVSSTPLSFPYQHHVNAVLSLLVLVMIGVFMLTASTIPFIAMTILACMLGILLILPIGGGDMPVVISILNSYSGWAAAGIGFTLSHPVLLVTGAQQMGLSSHPRLHNVQGDESLDYQRDFEWIWDFKRYRCIF